MTRLLTLGLALLAVACAPVEEGPLVDQSDEAMLDLEIDPEARIACSDGVELPTHLYDVETLRAELTEPALIDDGVLFIPEHHAFEVEEGGRTLRTYALGRLDGLNVRGPNGPTSGSYWDCQCSANDDSGCYWRHLGGLSYCKGSCGDTRCGAKLIEPDDLEIGRIVMP